MAPHPSGVDTADTELDGPESEAIDPGVRAGDWRLLLVVALGPLITGYAAVAALLALVTATAAKADFSTSGVLLAAGPGWLAAHQVPLDIAGGRLGMEPLLPTIGMVVLVACTTAGAAGRGFTSAARDSRWLILAATASHALFGAALTLALPGNGVAAPVSAGVCCPAVLAGVAALIGLWWHQRPDLPGWFPESVRVGVVAGVRGLILLVTAGALTFAVGLVTSLATAGELLNLSAPETGSAFGLVLLSLGYLPNAVIGGLAFLTGPGLSIGAYSVGPLRFVAGDVPGVPLLAALPEAQQSWWPLVLLVPLAVGGYLGWSLRHATPRAGPVSLGVAAVVLAIGCLVLCAGAGGRLADGPFDPVTVYPWRVAAAGLGWTALPGAAVLGGVAGIRALRARFRTDDLAVDDRS
jgi:hypothetical protein